MVAKLAAFGLMTIAFLSYGKATAQNYSVIYNFDGTHGSYPYLDALTQGRDGNLYGTTKSGGSTDNGVVFMMTPTGEVNVLYNFDGTHGASPRAGLTLGRDGNFYGTTLAGGDCTYCTGGCGTVFKITAAGALTVLHDFMNGADGANPYGAPVQARNGSFYGTTAVGTAYKITPSGAFTALGHIPGGPYYSFSPLIQAADGKLYATTYGDDLGGPPYGNVFSMTATGLSKVVYNFDGTHGANPVSSIVQSSDGNFYGTTDAGGSLNSGVVFKLTPKAIYTALHDFDCLTGCLSLGGLLYANDGNFYGVSQSGGTSGFYGVIFKITSTGNYSVLYNFSGSDGSYASGTPMQHTNGKIYGLARSGGTSNHGVVYSLDSGLVPFVRLMTNSGKAGQVVQMLGQGFAGTTGVKFGTSSAVFTVVSDTYMTAKVPVAGTTGPVTVTTPGGTLTSNTKFKVIPSITSFGPTSGTVGTSVIIIGTGLKETTKVTFGGVKATFRVNSGTQVTATVPVGAVTGKIAVTTLGGTAARGTFIVY